MNRLERISAILVRLQSRSVVTARQLAEQYQVSQRTIYRDIRVLEESGVPVTGDAGVGYSLVEGFKLPPLHFTTDEAIAFLMAEKLVGYQSHPDSYNLYRSGMDKIRVVLQSVEKNMLEDFDNYLHVVEFTSKPPQPATDILQPVLTAILQKQPVEIDYFANYNLEQTIRIVEPLGIYYMGQNWLLLAWCRLRNAYRSFAISRIRRITPLDDIFCRTHSPFSRLVHELYCEEPEYIITIQVKKSALGHIGIGKYMFGIISEEDKGDFVIQQYKVHSLEYFARWYLSYGDQASIISPPELKEITASLIKNIQV